MLGLFGRCGGLVGFGRGGRPGLVDDDADGRLRLEFGDDDGLDGGREVELDVLKEKVDDLASFGTEELRG